MLFTIETVLTQLFPQQDPATSLLKLERKMEVGLIDLLSRLDLSASVKSEPKSLPYQREIIQHIYTESYLNGVLEYHRCYRTIVQELLNQEVYKLRFYVQITPQGNKLEYAFRYYVH